MYDSIYLRYWCVFLVRVGHQFIEAEGRRVLPEAGRRSKGGIIV
jgi:hypothetical protein